MKQFFTTLSLPLFIWLLGVILVTSGSFSSVQKTEDPTNREITGSLANGSFEANFTASTGTWLWKFSHLGRDGCEQLLLEEGSPVQVSQTNIISLHLKTYRTDSFCAQPAAEIVYTGRINASGDSNFEVILDGSRVFTSQK